MLNFFLRASYPMVKVLEQKLVMVGLRSNQLVVHKAPTETDGQNALKRRYAMC